MIYFLRFLLFRRFTLKDGSKTRCFGYFFLLFGFFCFFLWFLVRFCAAYFGGLRIFLGLFFFRSVVLVAGGCHMVRTSPCFEAFFFCVSLFLLFLFCFCVCFRFFGRVRVQILFFAVFAGLRLKTVQKPGVLATFFCSLALFVFFCGFWFGFVRLISGGFGFFGGCFSSAPSFWRPAVLRFKCRHSSNEAYSLSMHLASRCKYLFNLEHWTRCRH